MIRERLTDWWVVRSKLRSVKKMQRMMIDVTEDDIRSILNEIEAENQKV